MIASTSHIIHDRKRQLVCSLGLTGPNLCNATDIGKAKVWAFPSHPFGSHPLLPQNSPHLRSLSRSMKTLNAGNQPIQTREIHNA
jgi:hypothetical protein